MIALWKHIQSGEKLLDSVPRELYNDVRNNIETNKYEDWFIGNVGFLSSFNGRWFDGGYAQTGIEITKTGKRIRNYYEESKNNILNQFDAIQGVKFLNSDYRNYHPENSVIYLDPPYNNTKKYANAKEFDYDCFWDVVRKWSENNFVFVSEETAPTDMTCIWEQPVSRSIKPNDKQISIEKLFIYNKKLR